VLKDKQGRPFNPALHVGANVTNEDGTLKVRTSWTTTSPEGEISTAAPRTRKRKKGALSGGERKLADLAPRAGFIRRWFTNTEGRIQRFIDRDWEVVESDSQSTERGIGGGDRGILMEIPEEFYKEDQAEKTANIRNIERKSDQLGDGEYSPRGKDTALEVDKTPLR